MMHIVKHWIQNKTFCKKKTILPFPFLLNVLTIVVFPILVCYPTLFYSNFFVRQVGLEIYSNNCIQMKVLIRIICIQVYYVKRIFCTFLMIYF